MVLGCRVVARVLRVSLEAQLLFSDSGVPHCGVLGYGYMYRIVYTKLQVLGCLHELFSHYSCVEL